MMHVSWFLTLYAVMAALTVSRLFFSGPPKIPRLTSGPRAQALAQTLLEKLLEIDINVDVGLHRYR